MIRRIALLLVAAIPALLVYISLVALPQSALRPEYLPLTTSPEDVGLSFESFTVKPVDRDITLAGWWIPAANARATLVFVHGGGSHRNSRFFKSLEFYRAMVDQGVSVVAIELRNHGDSGKDERGMQMGATEKYDVLAAVDWAFQRTPELPIFLMGISMGGASAIQAIYAGADVRGLILLDSVLDTRDTMVTAGAASTGLPGALFLPSAWSAERFFGLPSGNETALARAIELDTPILVMVDPADPVTRAVHSETLARRNPNASLWRAPDIAPDHEEIAWRDYWGTHVAAFAVYPEQTIARVMHFIQEQETSL